MHAMNAVTLFASIWTCGLPSSAAATVLTLDPAVTPCLGTRKRSAYVVVHMPCASQGLLRTPQAPRAEPSRAIT